MTAGGGDGAMILWGRRSSGNVHRVLFLLGEIGLDPEIREVGGAFGGLDAAPFAGLTPVRRVPVLQDGPLAVWESHAILRYLANRYAPALYGDSPATRAPVDMVLDWTLSTLWLPIRAFFQEGFKAGVPLDDPRFAADHAALADTLAVLAQLLSDRPYVAGEAFSLGDITVAVSLNRLLGLLPDHPLPGPVEPWLWRITDRPAFRPVTEGEFPDLVRWRDTRPRP